MTLQAIRDAKAYLFDMDGLLIDNTRYHVLGWLELAKKYGCRLTEADAIAWMGAPGRDYVRRVFGRPDMPLEEVMPLLEEKEAFYRKVYRPHLKPNAGVRAFLDDACGRGVTCALVTGGSRANVDFILDGLQFRRYFRVILDASRYERGKPFPDCYLQAAELLGVKPADCIVFEDALNGLEAARAGGIRTVALVGTNPRETLEKAGADRVIGSFEELLCPR